MKKFLFLILGCLILMGAGCKQNIEKTANQTLGLETVNMGQQAIKDLAEARAKELFNQKVNEGLDFSNGPCLSEEIIDDWSVDIAHSPRQTVDDEAANQCQNFRNGKTHHFVELDTNGNVINVK